MLIPTKNYAVKTGRPRIVRACKFRPKKEKRKKMKSEIKSDFNKAAIRIYSNE